MHLNEEKIALQIYKTLRPPLHLKNHPIEGQYRPRLEPLILLGHRFEAKNGPASIFVELLHKEHGGDIRRGYHKICSTVSIDQPLR